MDINEVKYNDLNSTKKLKSVQDVQRAAHSQGYDVSEPKNSVGDHYTVDLTHRKTGQKVTPRHGGKLGGSDNGKGVDTTLVNQVASTIKGDAAARGRVDKRGPAKAKRKAEAAKNKAAKAKNRDPFRRMKEGVTFKDFVSLCEQGRR